MKNYRPLICLSLLHTLVDTCAQLAEPLWPGIRAAYGFAGIGALSVLFIVQSLPTSLSQAVFGYMRDRRSLPWLLWVGPLLGAVCMSAIGLSDNRYLLGLLFIVGGFAIGAFHPEAAVAAGRALPNQRTRGLSMFMLGGALGLGLGPVLSGAIVRQWGVFGLINLLPYLLVLIFVLWKVGRLGTLAHVPRTDTKLPTILEAFDRRIGLAFLLFLVCSFRLVPNMAMGKVLSFTLENWQYDEFETGLMQSLFLVSASVGMFLMAFRFRSGWERSFLIWCPVAGVPVLLILGLENCPPWLFVTMLIIGGIILWGTTPAMVSYAQQQFPNGAGVASALTMGLAWGLGGLIQSPITAYFSDTAVPQQALHLFIPALLLSSIGAYFLPPIRQNIDSPKDT